MAIRKDLCMSLWWSCDCGGVVVAVVVWLWWCGCSGVTWLCGGVAMVVWL